MAKRMDGTKTKQKFYCNNKFKEKKTTLVQRKAI